MNDAELALIVAALDEGQVLITRHQEDEWGIARVGGDALERNVYRYWASARLAGYTYATIRTRLRRS
jgi:hypothetical protein